MFFKQNDTYSRDRALPRLKMNMEAE